MVSQAQICDYKVYYWRNKADEVDYVLVRRKKKVAIEVKSGRRTINNGLPKFAEAYKPHKSLVVGSGGLSFEEFLTMDLNLLFKQKYSHPIFMASDKSRLFIAESKK